MRHKLILAGGGSGTAEYLLPAAKKALEEVELVIASPRFLELLHARKTMPMGHISELLESLPAMLERESIGIVVSGDPLLYSLCRTLRNRYPELEMQVIPGIGSLQLLGAAGRIMPAPLPARFRSMRKLFSFVPAHRDRGRSRRHCWHTGCRIRKFSWGQI